MRKRWSFGERERCVNFVGADPCKLKDLMKMMILFSFVTCPPSLPEYLCWNFGGTGASSHTEYKITILTFETVSVFQMSQFGACLYSLWKAKFNGKKAGCLQVESLKSFFQTFYYLWPQYV